MIKLILKSKKIFQPVIFFLCLLFVLPVKAEQSFSNMFVFGDSMSDTGNLASVIGDFPPVYYNNRLSNGPVTVEILGERLGLSTDASLHLISQNAGTNYAVASATAGGNGDFDLNTQVNAFLAVHGSSAPEDALYVVFIGGNDVRSARDIESQQSVQAAMENAVDSIKKNINKLISSGAKFFVVMNSIDMGRIPEALLSISQLHYSPPSNRTTEITRLFNRLLEKSVNDIEDELDLEIAEFNSFKTLSRIIYRARSFGFSNTREPCFFYSTLTFHPDCDSGRNAGEFLFFDEKHTSARGNVLVGNALFKVVKEFDWKIDDDDDDDDDDDENCSSSSVPCDSASSINTQVLM